MTRVRGDHGELGRARGQRGYNTKIIKEFRAIGAESGIERSTPLASHPQPGRRLATWPPTGSPSRLGLYYNLKANPEITVELSTQALTVLAQELYDTARAGLWPSLVAKLPDLGRTQAKPARQLPIAFRNRRRLRTPRAAPPFCAVNDRPVAFHPGAQIWRLGVAHCRARCRPGCPWRKQCQAAAMVTGIMPGGLLVLCPAGEAGHGAARSRR